MPDKTISGGSQGEGLRIDSFLPFPPSNENLNPSQHIYKQLCILKFSAFEMPNAFFLHFWTLYCYNHSIRGCISNFDKKKSIWLLFILVSIRLIDIFV